MNAKKILIMGLPGAGKTHFAKLLKTYLETYSSIENMPKERLVSLDRTPMNWHAKVDWFNADDVRKKYNDWDFTNQGRIRQSLRMAEFALNCTGDYVICDFVAPLKEQRDNFNADWTIWMDTIDQSIYEDTNKLFASPKSYDFRITEKDAEKWVPFVGDYILKEKRRPIFDWKKETVQMLGRWQPWHAGHRALFQKAITKTGQVCIMIRDCLGYENKNPFNLDQVTNYIKRDLDPFYQGQYEIIVVPNIVEIVYGRDVGYKISKIELSDEIHQISATAIREEMKNKGLL